MQDLRSFKSENIVYVNMLSQVHFKMTLNVPLYFLDDYLYSVFLYCLSSILNSPQVCSFSLPFRNSTWHEFFFSDIETLGLGFCSLLFVRMSFCSLCIFKGKFQSLDRLYDIVLYLHLLKHCLLQLHSQALDRYFLWTWW